MQGNVGGDEEYRHADGERPGGGEVLAPEAQDEFGQRTEDQSEDGENGREAQGGKGLRR